MRYPPWVRFQTQNPCNAVGVMPLCGSALGDSAGTHGSAGPSRASAIERSYAGSLGSSSDANSSDVLEKAAARRCPPRTPELTHCSECDELTGRQRIICGKAGCRERRFKRTNPEAYAERDRRWNAAASVDGRNGRS